MLDNKKHWSLFPGITGSLRYHDILASMLVLVIFVYRASLLLYPNLVTSVLTYG